MAIRGIRWFSVLKSPSLRHLQHLSVLDNKLEEIPAEIGHLTKLIEINLASNKLSSLPHQLYQCKHLTKIHVARNKLTSLPEVTSDLSLLIFSFCTQQCTV